MRAGKSFVLNYFLRYLKARYIHHDVTNWLGGDDEPLKGFDWREGLDALTSGIMVWSEVFLCDDHPSGEKYAIVLMDTEGFFEHTQTTFDHSAIFSLSTVMASTQIYNIFRDLNQSNLKNILQFSNEGVIKMRLEFTAPFQRLVLLIRDWSMPHSAAYGAEGGAELLTHRMQGLLGPHVRGFFQSMECFLMSNIGPISAERADFDGRCRWLHPKFVDLLNSFVPMILAPEKLQPKMLNGYPLNAEQFVNNFEFYAAFYSKGSVDGFTGVIDNNYALNALTASVEVYRNFIDKIRKTRSIVTLKQLKSCHKEAKACSLEYYDGCVKVDPEITAVYRQSLERYLDQIFNIVFDTVRELSGSGSENFDESVTDRFYSQVKDMISKIKDFFPIIGNALRDLWNTLPEEYRTDLGDEVRRIVVTKIVKAVSKVLETI